MIRLQSIFDIPPEYAKARFALLFSGTKDLQAKSNFLLRPFSEALKHIEWKLNNHGKWKGDDYFIMDSWSPIGYAQWFNSTRVTKDPVIELGFFLDAEHRNRGYGSWAIKELEEKLEPIESFLTLCPLKTNERAINLYKKLGYKIQPSNVAKEKGYEYLTKEL